MATNIIYKGELNGTQVDFQTGSLTDISTFDTDVRSSAIQDSIANGVTDRGASQDAIHSMSGYLAANAHPSVSAAADTGLALSNGNVIQDIDLAFDDLGHVETATFTSIDLDGRYYEQSEVQTISGVLNTKITGNDAELTTLRTATGTLSTATGNLDGRINSNDGELTALRAATGVLRADVDSNDTELGVLRTATGDLNGRIDTNDTELGTLRTATGYLENEIDSLQAVSGSFLSLTLDDVCDNGAITNQDIQVEDLRVNGGNITGPAVITIDPDAAGLSGKVIIAGDLQVDGTTTTINSTSVQIDDLSLVLGTGAPNNAAADGGGIIIDGSGAANIAEFTYDGTNNRWKTNSIDIAADIVGNASTASAWVADSTITLDGDLAGAVTFNADSSETLTATIGAGVVENDMLENASVAITGGAGLAGGGNAVLGGSAVSLSISAGHGLTAGTDALDINLDGTTLSKGASGLKVNSIGTAQLDANSVTSAELHSSVAGENITFNGGELQVLDTDIRAAITGGASSIAGTNLGTSKALISNSSGKVAVSTVTSTELSQLAGIGGTTVSAQLALKADDSTQMSASDGLTGGGTLAADRSFSTTADQGHLDEIELGTSNTTASNVVTKGGILILRGTDNNGITTSGSDGNAVALNDKTTVAFEGVVQSTDTAQDADNGTYVAMWKIQGVIRRDSNSTDMLSSFVTKTFAGSSASSYGLSVSVNGNGLKIASDQTTATLITSATINYNWVEETN
jgi:hypothetical protein